MINAIILTGGQGERLGGADKATLRIDGDHLVSRSLTAVTDAGVSHYVIVGDPSDSFDAPTVREEPAFGGPAAAVAAGLQYLSSHDGAGELVLVLAVDLVNPQSVVATLTAALPLSHDYDGIILRAPDGYLQWLAALYRREYLDAAVAGLKTPSGTSMRRLISGADLLVIDAPQDTIADIDTWDDFAKYSHEKGQS